MKIILAILISAFLGVGTGYGAYLIVKPNQKAPQTQEAKATDTKEAPKSNNDITNEINSLSDLDNQSIKYLYDNDELTKEGAIAFLKIRGQVYDLKPEIIEKMIKNFERLTQKMPVIDAFKIIAIQNQLLEFRDFTNPKLKGL